MYALILEDICGSQEIIAESKSRNKLIKMLKEFIDDGYNEACLNVVELEDEYDQSF